MASTEVTCCCSLEVLVGLQSKRQYILCPAGGGWTAGLIITHQSTYAWHLQYGGLKVVKVLRWQLRSPRVEVPRARHLGAPYLQANGNAGSSGPRGRGA